VRHVGNQISTKTHLHPHLQAGVIRVELTKQVYIYPKYICLLRLGSCYVIQLQSILSTVLSRRLHILLEETYCYPRSEAVSVHASQASTGGTTRQHSTAVLLIWTNCRQTASRIKNAHTEHHGDLHLTTCHRQIRQSTARSHGQACRSFVCKK